MAEVLYNAQEELHASSHTVMSERVQALANSVYREFELMIGTYGDAVIKNLMPQVVSILENLNLAYKEKQEQEVESELLREENNNLRLQFEKEKQLRKMTEQKYLETEDAAEEERRTHTHRVEALEATVRRLEVKVRNTQDLLARQEESKSEIKEEYTKLHKRYNEVLRSHADHMERAKLHTADRSGDNSSPRRGSLPVAAATLRPVTVTTSVEKSRGCDPAEAADESSAIQNGKVLVEECETESSPHLELKQETRINPFNSLQKGDGSSGQAEISTDNTGGLEESQSMRQTETDLTERVSDVKLSSSHTDWNVSSIGSSLVHGMEYEDDFDPTTSESLQSNIAESEIPRSTNSSSIFAELSNHNLEALAEIDMGSDLSVMTAEVEKIIQENNELLATKNALNIVKDDLIAQLDELTGEHELLREELQSCTLARERLEVRVSELEEEVKRAREQLEETTNNQAEESKNWFSRMDMARVIMERNSFKEKLMELQEAMRYAETLRASRNNPELVNSSSATPGSVNKKKGAIWSFFSSLGGGGSTPTSPTSPTKSSSAISSLSATSPEATKNCSSSKANRPPTVI